MKILFLDFDGVLNRHGVRAEPPEWANPWPFKWIEDSLVRQLDPIIEHHPDVHIIISSTWRTMWELSDLKRILADGSEPVAKRVRDKTPDNARAHRGQEINDWFYESEMNPEEHRYAILDDDDDFEQEQMPYLIQTEGYAGLTEEDVDKVLTILKGGRLA